MFKRVFDWWMTIMAILGSVMVAYVAVSFVTCGMADVLHLMKPSYRNAVLIHYLRPDPVDVEVLEEDGTPIGGSYLHDPCTLTQSEDCTGDYYAWCSAR